MKRFQIHARKALLSCGTIDNRDIPPLRYDVVYQLVKDFPEVSFEINGGIGNIILTLTLSSHLPPPSPPLTSPPLTSPPLTSILTSLQHLRKQYMINWSIIDMD